MADRVETVFTAVDQASGPLRQVADQAERTGRAMSEAQRVVKDPMGRAVGGGVPPTAVPPQLIPPDVPDRDKAAEKALAEAKKAATKETREYTHGLRAGNIQMNLIGSVTGVLGVEMTGVVGKAGQLANVMDSAAMSFARMGPKFRGASELFDKLGGKLEQATIAFAAGQKLGEGVNYLSEKIWGISATGILENALGVGQQQAQEQDRANMEYIKARGYVSAADYKAGSEITARYQQEAKLKDAMKGQAALIGALPTNATGAQMERFSERMLQAAKSISLMSGGAISVADAMEGLQRDVAAGMPQAIQGMMEGMQSKQTMTAGAEKLIQAYEIEALGIDASAEDREAFNQRNNMLAAGYLKNLQDLGDATAYTASDIATLGAMISEGTTTTLKAVMDRTGAEMQQAGDINRQVSETIKGRAKVNESNKAAYDAQAKWAIEQGKIIGAGMTPEKQAQIAKDVLGKTTKSSIGIHFNNARFDITQQFAEGFDPDRIAVAFSNDLATLGERRLQSALTRMGTSR